MFRFSLFVWVVEFKKAGLDIDSDLVMYSLSSTTAYLKLLVIFEL